MTGARDADPLDVALPYPEPPVTPPTDVTHPRGVGEVRGDDHAVAVSEQRLQVGTEWVVSGRVRVRRRVVVERRTVEVEVRREVLELEGDTVDFRDGHLVGTDQRGARVEPPTGTAPFVAVLREEVPVIGLQVRPYEQVTVTTSLVQDAVTVHDVVQREQVEITTHPPHTPEEN